MPESRPVVTPPVLGPWRLEALLAEGGTSRVYRARHAATRRAVALKVLRLGAGPRDRERLVREAEVLRRAHHPALVRLVEAGDGWIALELLEGPTLDDALRDGPLPVDQAAAVVAELCAAVHHLHQLGYRHGDLKPANAMLTPRGPVLIDLGHAGVASVTGPVSDPSGSWGWVPPEVMGGEPVDGRLADVFGLGSLLAACLHGSYRVPRSLGRLIARAASPRPADRPRSAADLLASIRAVTRRRRLARVARDAAAIGLVGAAMAVAPLGALSPWLAGPLGEATSTTIATRAPSPDGWMGSPVSTLADLWPERDRVIPPASVAVAAPPLATGAPTASGTARLDPSAQGVVLGVRTSPTARVQPVHGPLTPGRLTLFGAARGHRLGNIGEIEVQAGQVVRVWCSDLLGHCKEMN